MIIKNGKVWIGKLVKKNIIINKGKILEVTTKCPDSKKVIDAKGLVVLPGIIDPHVHFREPGLTHKEDFYTGSKAAASGGVTTFFDMPNNVPPILTRKDLIAKRKLAKKSIVNYGFYMGTDGDNIKEIRKVKNIVAVKVFMDATTGNMLISDLKKLEKIFASYRTIAVHAEGDNVLVAMKLAKKYKRRLYLCHISLAREIEMIRKFKRTYKNIFVEVCPHHLFLTKKDDKSNFTKMKPVLKSEKNRRALWKAIKNGLVDSIGSDHAPHTIAEKKKQLLYGIPGIETRLPLMLNAVNKKRISLARLVSLMSENPAKIFGLKNGKIAKGYFADLTIVDMNLIKKVNAKKLFSKCKWTPFNNWIIKGWPVMTIVNGNIVYDGKIHKNKGTEVKL